MKLKNINYKSAAFFGILTLVLSLIQGAFGLIISAAYPGQFPALTPVQALVSAPLIGGFLGYFFAIIVIWIYNFVARKGYPISWEVDKK